MRSEFPAEAAELLASPVDLVKYLEQQDVARTRSYATSIFEQLLRDAAQPKSISGQACVKLCGLVGQSLASSSTPLRQWAFSQEVTLKLFHFYIEWNESDNHRSMKLVLDSISQSILKNPHHEEALKTKEYALSHLVSIVVGRSTKPVAKSAIQILFVFLTKRIYSLDDLRTTYVSLQSSFSVQDVISIWKQLTIDLFRWMRLHFVCPTAGRFLVALYRQWRTRQNAREVPSVDDWHAWLLEILEQEPTLLESIKNYIFLPLFKADRTEALRFLSRMNEEQAISAASDPNMNIPALFQLAALETGKKVGLVEEPGKETPSNEFQAYKTKQDGRSALGSRDRADANDDRDTPRISITLREEVLERVLGHTSHEVRSLALSLLVTSPSTTRPYSEAAFGLLKRHLTAAFADPDAKFRVDVTARARDMFKRVRGAIHVLKRSIPRARAKAHKAKTPSLGQSTVLQPILYHSNLISLPEAQLAQCLDSHVRFLHWYLRFLCAQLVPTASYQRHITSVKALLYIVRMEGDKSKTWETTDDQEMFFDQLNQQWARALFDLILDPFEDVRETASVVLANCYADGRYRRLTLTSSIAGSVPVNELKDLSQRADELARRTGRADHSDGASRASQLLYRFLLSEEKIQMLSRMIGRLSTKISMAEDDLGKAVVEAPLHGDFASLCHIWQVLSETKHSQSEIEKVEKLQQDMVLSCERAWRAIRKILCDDSPEGHLPHDLDDVEGLDTKDLLSYSFRAVHESSNLMRAVILTVRNRARKGFVIPSREVSERIGDLTFTQLATLRHRGAFTTVSSTFATCCQQSKHLQSGDDEVSLLDRWFEGTMKVIFSQASTTRRSAGIPSMMTGILASNAAHPSFEQVMTKLIAIASEEVKVHDTDGTRLPQVHAFNCLKDIFKNSLLTSLGNKSELYLAPCLELAAKGLRSEVWAIRNCGLIFLRSLIDNLFGTHESKASIEAGWDGKAVGIHYHRYPTLPAVLENLLQSGHRMLAEATNVSSAAESVFPALDIIRRAGPPDLLRHEIQVHVAAYLSSPVWHVRDMAARALCSCLLHDQWLADIKTSFQAALAISSEGKENHVHGVLLTAKLVIRRLGDAHQQLLDELHAFHTFLLQLEIDVSFSHCHDVLAAYLDLINTIWVVETQNNLPRHALTVSTPSRTGSALLQIQKAVYDVYDLSSSTADPVPQLQSHLKDQRIGPSGLVATLEAIPRVWAPASCSQGMLISLCRLYATTALQTTHVEAQVLSMQNLTIVLDELISQRVHLDSSTSHVLLILWTGLADRTLTPALSNAILCASGCIFASVNVPSIDLTAWGDMIATAGQNDKTFDSRLAAATSLRYFTAQIEHALPLTALLALYDSLNDDDDEVRDMAATAAQPLTGRALVPLEAASQLLQHLTATFSTDPTFRAIVTDRLVGHTSPSAWMPAQTQLTQAMRFDDSLFVVEEQNLFVDEVRESQRWVTVFDALDWSPHDENLQKLLQWVQPGLAKLAEMAHMEDGPLGWASSPAVFAICSRLIRASVALGRKVTEPGLERAIINVRESFVSSDARISMLLHDAWKDEEGSHAHSDLREAPS